MDQKISLGQIHENTGGRDESWYSLYFDTDKGEFFIEREFQNLPVRGKSHDGTEVRPLREYHKSDDVFKKAVDAIGKKLTKTK